MLTRVYVNNFRCFVNFEFRPTAKQLILGRNGTGKSALFEALALVRQFAIEGTFADALFPAVTRTRWMDLAEQEFELEIKTTEGSYIYKLLLEPWGSPPKIRVRIESLTLDGRHVFLFQSGEVHLYNDRYERKVTYPFDWYRSALATILPRPENTKLTRFKEHIARLCCLRLDPRRMTARADREDPDPQTDLSNFAAWYRHVTQEQSKHGFELQRKIQEVLNGFDSLNLISAGQNVRLLTATFASGISDKDAQPSPRQFPLDFDELSDGQRVLIALYTVLQFLVRSDSILCIDEPDNFISLPEIQPWLFSTLDRVEDEGGQVILISHHPELMNQLAVDHGVTFVRAGFGPVRVEKYQVPRDTALPPSELIARGWDRE